MASVVRIRRSLFNIKPTVPMAEFWHHPGDASVVANTDQDRHCGSRALSPAGPYPVPTAIQANLNWPLGA
jgi:hypothetical protein